LAEGKKSANVKHFLTLPPPPPAKTIGEEGLFPEKNLGFRRFGVAFGARGSLFFLTAKTCNFARPACFRGGRTDGVLERFAFFS
jgi:hypothetical protein